MSFRSKRSWLSSRATTKRFCLLRCFGGPRFTCPGFAPIFTLAVLRTWSFGHRSLMCLSSRSGRTPVPQCGQSASGDFVFFAAWGGCAATRRGPIAALSAFFNLIRLLGRATIALNSRSKVVLVKGRLAPNVPSTPVPLQRKQLGLAPRQVQSGTPIEYNGAAAITTGSSQTSRLRCSAAATAVETSPIPVSEPTASVAPNAAGRAHMARVAP